MIPRLDLKGSNPSNVIQLNWVLHCQAGMRQSKIVRTHLPAL